MLRHFLRFLLLALVLAGCSTEQRAVRTLRSSADPAVRLAAVERLLTSEPDDEARPGVVKALADAAMDPDQPVRLKAIEGLGTIGGLEAKQALLDIVEGRNYARAALAEYRATDRLTGESGDVLLAMGQAEMSLGELRQAEKSLSGATSVLEASEGYDVQRTLYGLLFALQDLQSRYDQDGDTKGSERVGKLLERVGEKQKSMESQGGMPPGLSF